MSPLNFNNGYANMFAVNSNGYLEGWNVNNTPGVRPLSFLNSYTLVKAKYSSIRIQD